MTKTTMPAGNRYPDPTEPYEATSVEVYRGSDRSMLGLEIRVNIEGRDRRVLLRLDALANHGLSGPAAGEELRGIREAVESLVMAVKRSLEKE